MAAIIIIVIIITFINFLHDKSGSEMVVETFVFQNSILMVFFCIF